MKSTEKDDTYTDSDQMRPMFFHHSLVGFVIATILALWPVWPAWVQLAAIPAALLSGVAVVSLLLHLVASNPVRHPLVWLAPCLGWAVAMNAEGGNADGLDWASSFVVMFIAGYAARVFLATYTRRRAGMAD